MIRFARIKQQMEIALKLEIVGRADFKIQQAYNRLEGDWIRTKFRLT
mgnify:FL=1